MNHWVWIALAWVLVSPIAVAVLLGLLRGCESAYPACGWEAVDLAPQPVTARIPPARVWPAPPPRMPLA